MPFTLVKALFEHCGGLEDPSISLDASVEGARTTKIDSRWDLSRKLGYL
jgi:hypothetical protein